MNTLKEQAVDILYSLPDEKMSYIIDILKTIIGIINNESKQPAMETASSEKAVIAANDNSSVVSESWKRFQAYKGIIPYDINEKAELAEARKEKYAGSI